MRVRADSLSKSTLVALAALLVASCAAPGAEVAAPSPAPSYTNDVEESPEPSASSDGAFEPEPSASSEEDAEPDPGDLVSSELVPGDSSSPGAAPAAVPPGGPEPAAKLSSPLFDPDDLPLLWSERVGNALGASGALSVWLANCSGWHPPGCTGGFVSGELGVFGVAGELGVGFTMPQGYRYIGVSAAGMTIGPSLLHQWRNWSDDLEAPRTLWGATLGLTYVVTLRGGVYAHEDGMMVTGSIGVGN